MNDAELKIELQYLDSTKRFLQEWLYSLESELDTRQAALAEQLRWIRSDAGAPQVIREEGDIAAISTINDMLSDHERPIQSLNLTVKQLTRALSTPYFGRVDFLESGDTLPVYIGRCGIFDGEHRTHYVFDWRAPVASLFYQGGCGLASYQTPNGEVSGDITLRRQYGISNGEMEYCVDAEGIVADDILGKALFETSHNSGMQLRIIVESLQREQDAAIRAAHTDLLVTGPAGSGKSSVGMHRLAYLLYNDREHLRAENIVILSNSAIFSDYLTGILPELGEGECENLIFPEIVKSVLPRGTKFDRPFNQLEHLMISGDDIRSRTVNAVCSTEFLTHIELFFEGLTLTATGFSFLGETLLTSEKAHNFISQELPFSARLSRLVTLCESECESVFTANRAELLAKFRGSSDEWPSENALRQTFIQKWERFLREIESSILECNHLTHSELYIELLQTFSNDTELADAAAQRVAAREFLFEDVVVFACISERLGKLKPRYSVSHVLVDEAQDYPAPAHYLLRKLYPKARFTYLADCNQAVAPVASMTETNALTAALPTGTAQLRLERSYRCTGPINALACALPGIGSAQYFDRDGDLPVFTITDNIAAEIARLLALIEFEQGSIGIITRTAEEARQLHRKIGHSVALINTPDKRIRDRMVIIPVVLAKGLEFETVIAVTDNLENNTNALYLMLTRALHKLYMVGTALPPQLKALGDRFVLQQH